MNNSYVGEVSELREKLNELVANNADFDEIYKISVALDKLILLYYKKDESA